MNKLLRYLTALAATLCLAAGLHAAAERLDPLARTDRAAEQQPAPDLGGLPCLPCDDGDTP